jgi:hypothetical protein
MKSYRFYMMTLFVVTSLIMVIIGCKYDVAEPLWNSPPASSTEVSITNVDPAQATPGVNYITIHGTNLLGALDSNKVRVTRYNDTTGAVVRDTTYMFIYNGILFNNIQATVLELSPTMIKVNRPNVASDDCTIKIASEQALASVKFGPYKIDAVMEPFGGFVANVILGAIAIDNAENVYVINGVTPFNIYKITPTGDKTVIGVAPWIPTDASIGPDGNLYYTNNVVPTTLKPKEIRMVDVNAQSTADSLWSALNIVKNINFGDFASNGNFYAGGRRTSVVVVRPNHSTRVDAYYATDTILAMRAFNNYLYVGVRAGIWRHSLSDTSVIGAPEQVIDLTQGILAAARPLKAFSFSSDGTKMYIGTDSKYPVLVADATTFPISIDKVEPLYKDILPTNCKQFCFGNKIFMISGNASPAVTWNVYKIDVGTDGVDNH